MRRAPARVAHVVLLLASLLPALAGAQQARARAASPVDDVLDRITGDINDLRYADALRRGRGIAGSEQSLPLAQRVRWRLLMAAAFYPDDEKRHQHPDSALRHLRALVRIAPDARYRPEMRWHGLDSLLDIARERTLGAVARAPATQRVGGANATGRVDVIATRRVRVSVAVVDAEGAVLQHASGTGDSVRLELRANDGRRVLLPPGGHDLVLVAHDLADDRDSVVTRYALVVEGSPPMLEPEPPLAASALLPESVAPARGPLLAKGVVFTGFTLAIATAGRADETLRDRFSDDGRAYLVGGAIVASVAAIIATSRSRPIPANIAANEATRAEHDRSIQRVLDVNRGRLRNHVVTVRIAPEPR